MVKLVDEHRKERRSFSNSCRSLNGIEEDRRVFTDLQPFLQDPVHGNGISSKSTECDTAVQRVAFLATKALRSLDSIAVNRWDSAALQTLRVGSQRRRRISDRSVMASVRDRERESLLLLLLVLLVRCVCMCEATHAALDLGTD